MRASRRITMSPVLLSAVVASQVLAVSVAPSWAQGRISVRLNGNPVTFREAEPTKISGKVLVPMREVFSVMRASVEYQSATRTIVAKRGAREIQLVLGSAQGFINGQPIALSQPAQLIGRSTYVPLRFVADALGAQVDWNEASQTVFITDASISSQPGTNNGGGNPTIDRNAKVGVLQRVDAEFPPRIVARVENQVRSYDVAPDIEAFRQNSVSTQNNGAPAYGALVPIELEDLSPNEEVRLSLNAQGQVSKIVVLRVLRTARVRSVEGNQIVLEDGTVVSLNSQLRYIDAQGRAVTQATVTPGQTVAVFLRPGNSAIYQISSQATDIAAAAANSTNTNTGNNGNTNPNPNTNNQTGARIDLVSHNATAPLKVGGTIVVTVRGTVGLRGVFDLSPRLQNLPLTPAQNGVYRGTYVVKAGDDVFNSFVTARLSDGAGNDDIAQSAESFTFDTIAPRETRVSPSNGETVNDARPTITISIDDVGGSGLGFARITVAGADGKAFDVPATIVPPSTVTAQIPRAMSGRVTVKWEVGDRAKNGRRGIVTFNVAPRVGAIRSVTQSATRPLRVGEALRVDLIATPGGRATFDLLDENNQIVVNRVPMTEINGAEGRYQGTYTVANTLNASDLTVRARFTDANGATDTLDTTNSVALANAPGEANRALSITTPGPNAPATSPLTIRGRATPNSVVDVTVTARGTRTIFGLIGYKEFQQVLDTQQIQADAAGNWLTRPVALTTPRNVTDLKYEISATQTDAGNQKSEPEIVTITPAQ